jgi:archaellum component FlaC
MDNDEDLVVAIQTMTLAAERQKAAASRIQELERQIEVLTTDKNSFAQENAELSDLIAELEAKVNNENDEADNSLLGDDDGDDGGGDDGGDGGGGGGNSNTRYRRPLLPIPRGKVSYLVRRISTGERLTVYNCMYIGLYCKDDRYARADKFRDDIVEAFGKMCRHFASDKELAKKIKFKVDLDNISTDFTVVKRKLNEFATLNQREFIDAMFDMLEKF